MADSDTICTNGQPRDLPRRDGTVVDIAGKQHGSFAMLLTNGKTAASRIVAAKLGKMPTSLEWHLIIVTCALCVTRCGLRKRRGNLTLGV